MWHSKRGKEICETYISGSGTQFKYENIHTQRETPTVQSHAVRFWMAPTAASMETGLVQVLSTVRYLSIRSLLHSGRYSLADAGNLGASL